MKILIVDDEAPIRELLKYNLEKEGFFTLQAENAAQAVGLSKLELPDLILLDLMLPDLSGLEVCKILKKDKLTEKIPIIMVTAKTEDEDVVAGLELGADDYITKPFNILEVKARIKAIMRRTRVKEVEVVNPRLITSGDMKIDLDSRRVFISDKEVNLTAKEFDLLELLITNPNKVYNRENLLNLVWGYDYPGDVRTVDVHVRRLREKVEANPSEPRYIHTKWGVGYFFQS